MKNFLYLSSTFVLLFCTVFSLHAQTPAPEQDCINALPVCQNIFTQQNSYVDEGLDPDEISGLSCLGTEENNDVWYIFTVQQSGSLCFTITPNSPTDDYDWAVYNLTNANCADIRNNISLEVSCNFAENVGCNGLTGPNGATTGACARQNEPCVPVVAGQTYVVNVSNYSDTNFGYQLDFSQSTAVIFDNVPPEMTTASSNCTDIQIEFSENVVCSTVEPADFTLTGPDNTTYQVVGVNGMNCDAGGTFESSFDLTVSPATFSPGVYTVSLVGEVLDNCGNIALLSSQDVTIGFPNANFTIPEGICQDGAATIMYTGNSGTNATFTWTIDGGTSASGAPLTGPGPHEIQWDSDGIKDISLVVTENACSSDIITQSVEVYALPIASIAPLDAQCLSGNDFGFEYDGPSNILNYQWDFGDNNGTSIANPTHSYNSAGIKTIILQVSDANQCSSLDTATVEVYDQPTSSFSLTNVCQDAPLIIENVSSSPTGDPLGSYFWTLGNGQTSDLEIPQPEYARPGQYDIRLVVESTQGCADTSTNSFTIYPLPNASFSTRDVCAKDTAFFTNKSTIRPDIANDVLVNWSWDFGDGQNAKNEENTHHIYEVAGNYMIEMTATSDKGCSASSQEEIEIYPLPEAPAVQDQNVCFGDPAVLRAIPVKNTVVEWFEDPLTTDVFNKGPVYLTPPVTFAQTFYVESISDNGCRGDRVDIQLGLHSEGQGTIWRTDSILEIPSAIATMKLLGSIDGDRYFWDFGDGTTSTAADAVHEYAHPGLYEINLMVIDVNGCEYELSTEIEVKKIVFIHMPSAFTPNGDGHNDELFIKHKLIQQFQMQIFTRHGKKVFETTNPDFTWNGQSEGGEFLQEGVYVYVIKAVDVSGLKEEMAGTITLLR